MSLSQVLADVFGISRKPAKPEQQLPTIIVTQPAAAQAGKTQPSQRKQTEQTKRKGPPPMPAAGTALKPTNTQERLLVREAVSTARPSLGAPTPQQEYEQAKRAFLSSQPTAHAPASADIANLTEVDQEWSTLADQARQQKTMMMPPRRATAPVAMTPTTAPKRTLYMEGAIQVLPSPQAVTSTSSKPPAPKRTMVGIGSPTPPVAVHVPPQSRRPTPPPTAPTRTPGGNHTIMGFPQVPTAAAVPAATAKQRIMPPNTRQTITSGLFDKTRQPAMPAPLNAREQLRQGLSTEHGLWYLCQLSEIMSHEPQGDAKPITMDCNGLPMYSTGILERAIANGYRVILLIDRFNCKEQQPESNQPGWWMQYLASQDVVISIDQFSGSHADRLLWAWRSIYDAIGASQFVSPRMTHEQLRDSVHLYQVSRGNNIRAFNIRAAS